MINQFRSRFSSAEEIQDVLKKVDYDRPETSTQIRDLRMTSAIQGGQVASDASRVSDHHLKIIFTYLSQFGLQRWCPDIIGGSPTSLYNTAHESIALDSFQHVAANFGYSFKGVDLTHLENVPLLSRLYRNFVYYTERRKVVKEERNGPGSVEEDVSKTEIYKRRKRVSFFILLIYRFGNLMFF